MSQKKPPEKRQNRVTNDLAVITGTGDTAIPDPPDGLNPHLVESWVDFWTSPLASLVQPVDLTPIRRLWLLTDELDRTLDTYRKARFVKGSQGQMVLNPMGRMIVPWSAEIRQLEARLGIGLRARMELGISFGDAARSLADVAGLMGAPPEMPDPRLP